VTAGCCSRSSPSSSSAPVWCCRSTWSTSTRCAGAFQLAAVIAPPVSGLLIGHALGSVHIGLLVVGCLVCGLLAVARLEPQLTPQVNGVRDDEPDGDGELTRPEVSAVD
jgi:hypothetical protein